MPVLTMPPMFARIREDSTAVSGTSACATWESMLTVAQIRPRTVGIPKCIDRHYGKSDAVGNLELDILEWWAIAAEDWNSAA